MSAPSPRPQPTTAPLAFPLSRLEREPLEFHEVRAGAWLTNLLEPEPGAAPIEATLDPVAITGRVSIESGHLLVRGTAHVAFHDAPCDRCLEPAAGTFDVDILLAGPLPRGHGAKEAADYTDDDETAPVVTQDRVDISAAVRSLIAADWPRHVFCRPDCKGLCPTCGVNLNVESCSCDGPPPDPRWAALKNVKVKK